MNSMFCKLKYKNHNIAKKKPVSYYIGIFLMVYLANL